MIIFAHPVLARGALAIVTDVEDGDAVDAGMFSACRVDEDILADGEIVRSRSPDAGIKPCVTNAGRRWLDKPGHRGEHV